MRVPRKCVLAIGMLALALATSTVGGQQTSGYGGFMSSIFAPITSLAKHASQFLGGAGGESGDIAGQESQGSLGVHLGRLGEQAFRMFAHLYNKTYSPEELPRRMKLFFERRKAIEESIRAYAEGRMPFMMRENAYVDSDDTELRALRGVAPPKRPDEFTPEDRQALLKAERALKRQRRSAIRPVDEMISAANDDDEMDFEMDAQEDDDRARDDQVVDEDPNLVVTATERIPATKDWRASGCVAAPINQHKCGACYAIATMGVLETMRCLNKVSSPTLSPQQVVDCSRAYNNFGCNGGWPTRVLKYLQDTGVAAREACYPFVRRQLTCRLRQVQSMGAGCAVSASPTDTRLNYKVLNNERDILYHVAKTGPVVTVMRATDKFLYYGGGIFDDATCSRRRDDVDHAIVIVGYGRQAGQDYWLIKNSWGESWGQSGYGLYKRGTNACSIGHWGWVITS